VVLTRKGKKKTKGEKEKIKSYTCTLSGNVWRRASEYSSVSLLALSRVALSLSTQIIFPSSLPL
jgi:hypothetical protein